MTWGEGLGGTDEALVQRILAGDREAYGILVERYQKSLYRHALGMVVSPAAAADLVQDSLVKGYLSLDQCQDGARFGAWVFRILRNRCLDYLKERRRKDVSLEEGAMGVAATDDPGVELERQQLGQAVADALSTLPEAQREAFLLKHVEGHSYEEMAEMMGSSVSALKMRVMRARESLQEALRPSGYDRAM